MLEVLFNSFGNYFGKKLSTCQNYYLGKYKNMHVHWVPLLSQLLCIKSLKIFQTEMGWMEYLKHDLISK